MNNQSKTKKEEKRVEADPCPPPSKKVKKQEENQETKINKKESTEIKINNTESKEGERSKKAESGREESEEAKSKMEERGEETEGAFSSLESLNPFLYRRKIMEVLAKTTILRPEEPESQFNDIALSHFPVEDVEVLTKGTEKFIKKSAGTDLVLSYTDWFTRVTNSMNERRFHVFPNFVYKKIKCVNRFSDKCVVHAQWHSCTERKLKSQNCSAQKQGVTLYINTKTFPEYDFGNAKMYIVHPTNPGKVVATCPLDMYQFDHVWAVSYIPEEFYFSTSYLLFCLVKNN